jgi:predicted nucleic-acid-binding Zn-ribbon protein
MSEIEEYGDEGVVTKDRDLTEEEVNEIIEKNKMLNDHGDIDPEPARKGLVKVKCKCGAVSTVSDEVVENGLSWSMIIGDDHFVTLSCPECEASLTLFIEEIVDNELPEESN